MLLTEESAPLDEKRLIGASAKTPFLKLGARAFFEKPYLSGV